ncbi:MAG TPA: PDZ domain-containing protein [Actinomycetota bacterium]|nr:PDZ domain-containing protein [Actinomycetota bacterium]
MRRLLLYVPAAVLVAALAAVEVPLVAIGPGHVREVLPLIDVRHRRTYEPQGRLFLTTVSIGRLTAFDAVAAWLDDDREVVTESDVFTPGVSIREFGRRSLSQMDESKTAAAVYVLTRLTAYPEEHGDGALVQSVVEGTPADGRLHPGETIVSVDGRPIDDADDVGRAIDRAGTGRALRFEVTAEGRTDHVSIRPTILRGEPVIGVILVPGFPFEIRFESGEDGGPSAGLMWAIGLADLLTPGNLLAGRTVAGTGAVDAEGTVYGIGSVGHKVRAAARKGAEVFLLPRANLEEGRAAGVSLPLVPVDTIDDALRYLEQGGT